jgi:hypothetical protein
MKKNRTLLWSILCLAMNGVWTACLADDEPVEKRHRKTLERGRDDHHHDKGDKGSKGVGNRKSNTTSNPTYREMCGACHFSYQPEFLPSASWRKILNQLTDHFGETVELDDNDRKVIGDYLETNAAEKTSSKRGVKIMRSLGNQTPLRITDISYVRKKHHEISPDVFARKSIGSFSNCAACHRTAEQGVYKDDNVSIPE